MCHSGFLELINQSRIHSTDCGLRFNVQKAFCFFTTTRGERRCCSIDEPKQKTISRCRCTSCFLVRLKNNSFLCHQNSISLSSVEWAFHQHGIDGIVQHFQTERGLRDVTVQGSRIGRDVSWHRGWCSASFWKPRRFVEGRFVQQAFMCQALTCVLPYLSLSQLSLNNWSRCKSKSCRTTKCTMPTVTVTSQTVNQFPL